MSHPLAFCHDADRFLSGVWVMAHCLSDRVANRFALWRTAGYFEEGEVIRYGKWKNKLGRIIRLFVDEKGNPAVEIEPIPKGRKKNKIFGLFRIWKEKPDMDKATPRVVNAFYRKARFGVGNTIENGTVRMHRYQNSLVVTDLTNAGKRGKKVDVMYVRPGRGSEEGILDRMETFIEDYDTFRQVVAGLRDFLYDFPDDLELEFSTERGVDVTPAGFKPLKLKGQGVSIEVGFKDFTVRNEDDQNNLPTCIPAISGGLKSIPVFYRWVKDNQDRIKSMSFNAVLNAMSDLGVKYHQYCAID